MVSPTNVNIGNPLSTLQPSTARSPVLNVDQVLNQNARTIAPREANTIRTHFRTMTYDTLISWIINAAPVSDTIKDQLIRAYISSGVLASYVEKIPAFQTTLYRFPETCEFLHPQQPRITAPQQTSQNTSQDAQFMTTLRRVAPNAEQAIRTHHLYRNIRTAQEFRDAILARNPDGSVVVRIRGCTDQNRRDIGAVFNRLFPSQVTTTTSIQPQPSQQSILYKNEVRGWVLNNLHQPRTAYNLIQGHLIFFPERRQEVQAILQELFLQHPIPDTIRTYLYPV